MLCLLYLLFKESPYSERYTAFWYFGGYMFFSSIPMFMVFFFFGCKYSSFLFGDWCFRLEDKRCLYLLVVLFVSKVPLFPFYGWLPVVHAEANSLVSVCLRGYIMKLGVLGLLRVCWWFIPIEVFFIGVVGFLVL